MRRTEKFQAEARSQWYCKYSLAFVLYFSVVQISHGENELDAHINRKGCGVSEPTGRVYNGNPIEKPQIPWMVQLVAITSPDWGIQCAGSVITHNVILTAAHCIETVPPAQRVAIYYNTTERNKGPVAYAERFIKHHSYDERYGIKYDIALLKVPFRIRFDMFVRPVCLPKRPIPLSGKQLISGGWGKISEREPPEYGEKLTYITLEAMSREMCRYLLSSATSGDGSGGYDAKFNLCTRTESGTLCKGDSGAPLTMRERNGRSVQVGVNSLATTCTERGKYEIAVRVAEFMPWIKKCLKNPGMWDTPPMS